MIQRPTNLWRINRQIDLIRRTAVRSVVIEAAIKESLKIKGSISIGSIADSGTAQFQKIRLIGELGGAAIDLPEETFTFGTGRTYLL